MRVSYSQRQNIAMSRSPSNPISHQQSNPNLHDYALKLEDQLKELTKMVKANRPIIQELQCRRKFYKKICEKQREKLMMADVETIKEEYEAELAELRLKKERLQEMAGNIHQEFQEHSSNNSSIRLNLLQNRTFLQNSLAELQAENTQYRQLLQKKMETMSNQKTQLTENQQLIKEKEKVQEKYEIVCQELRRMEGRPCNP